MYMYMCYIYIYIYILYIYAYIWYSPLKDYIEQNNSNNWKIGTQRCIVSFYKKICQCSIN